MNVVQIKTKHPMFWVAIQSESGWVAYCESIGLNSFGDSWPDLISTINEIIDLWIREEISCGTFISKAENLNWNFTHFSENDISNLKFEVPYNIVDPETYSLLKRITLEESENRSREIGAHRIIRGILGHDPGAESSVHDCDCPQCLEFRLNEK